MMEAGMLLALPVGSTHSSKKGLLSRSQGELVPHTTCICQLCLEDTTPNTAVAMIGC